MDTNTFSIACLANTLMPLRVGAPIPLLTLEVRITREDPAAVLPRANRVLAQRAPHVLLLMRAARHQAKAQIDDFAGRACWTRGGIGRQ